MRKLIAALAVSSLAIGIEQSGDFEELDATYAITSENMALRGIVWVNSRDIPEVKRSRSEGNRGLRGEGRRPEVPA